MRLRPKIQQIRATNQPSQHSLALNLPPPPPTNHHLPNSLLDPRRRHPPVPHLVQPVSHEGQPRTGRRGACLQDRA